MANRIKNIDSIQTSNGTIVDLENIQAASGGGNTFKDLEIQGGATGTSQDSVVYTVTATTVLSGVNIVRFHVTLNGGSTVTLENGVTSGFNSSSTGSCPITVPFNAAVGTDFVILATAEDDLGNVSKEFTKTVNLIANVKPTAPTAETFVKMSPSSLKNTQTVTFSGSTDTAGVGGSVVSYRVKNISDSVLTVDAATVAAGSAHTFRLAADATVSQYWSDNSLTNSKNATFDVVAIDNVGLESDPTQMQIEIDKNRPPTAPSSQALTLLKEEESRAITFGGSVDTDGSVVSYKVSNISDPCLTVANPIVNAGDPHQFTAGIRSVIETFLNGATEAQDVTFDVTAIDDLGMESPVTTMTIPVDIVRAGEVVFTTAGLYSWTVPPGVTSVCVVCVGPGGRGYYGYSEHCYGGGGGALGWRNNIPTTPGEVIQLRVGTTPSDTSSRDQMYYSWFRGSTSVSPNVQAQHGYYYTPNANAQFYGEGGGQGGATESPGTYNGTGGAGAGGYTGYGGKAYSDVGNKSDADGQGGGGGAGQGAHWSRGGGGGGVGLFGQGANGSRSSTNYSVHSNLYSGGGGGGSNGDSGSSASNGGHGGLYGGGGGGGHTYYGYQPGNGGGGAVRIMWGDGRSFPNNAA